MGLAKAVTNSPFILLLHCSTFSAFPSGYQHASSISSFSSSISTTLRRENYAHVVLFDIKQLIVPWFESFNYLFENNYRRAFLHCGGKDNRINIDNENTSLRRLTQISFPIHSGVNAMDTDGENRGVKRRMDKQHSSNDQAIALKGEILTKGVSRRYHPNSPLQIRSPGAERQKVNPPVSSLREQNIAAIGNQPTRVKGPSQIRTSGVDGQKSNNHPASSFREQKKAAAANAQFQTNGPLQKRSSDANQQKSINRPASSLKEQISAARVNHRSQMKGSLQLGSTDANQQKSSINRPVASLKEQISSARVNHRSQMKGSLQLGPPDANQQKSGINYQASSLKGQNIATRVNSQSQINSPFQTRPPAAEKQETSNHPASLVREQNLVANSNSQSQMNRPSQTRAFDRDSDQKRSNTPPATSTQEGQIFSTEVKHRPRRKGGQSQKRSSGGRATIRQRSDGTELRGTSTSESFEEALKEALESPELNENIFIGESPELFNTINATTLLTTAPHSSEPEVVMSINYHLDSSNQSWGNAMNNSSSNQSSYDPRLHHLTNRTRQGHIKTVKDKKRNHRAYFWLPKDAAIFAVKEFRRNEALRQASSYPPSSSLDDRRSSNPFITGNGFRDHCYPHICEENECQRKLSPSNVTSGQCVFVASSMLPFFVEKKLPFIVNPFRLVTDKADDQSTPDSQGLVRSDLGTLPKFEYLPMFQEMHETGKLITHFAVNLYWKHYDIPPHHSRPNFTHCIPIGLENRDGTFGSQIETIYIKALEHFVIKRNRTAFVRPHHLLLVSDRPEIRKPDRQKLSKVFPKREKYPSFYINKGQMTVMQWLNDIASYPFVLCPFGHGLDTHRLMEVLLLGGIPVIRRSTITSCYDDSDNVIGNLTRGSLPIVVVDRWQQVTQERLVQEWNRISSVDPSDWDWRRLFLEHWLQRLDATIPLSNEDYE